jgi:leucyl/phenylalanyl-tRNA--protein transferase
LRRGGYLLLDTQFVTPHLATFGAIELSRPAYLMRLKRATAHNPPENVWANSDEFTGAQALGWVEQKADPS